MPQSVVRSLIVILSSGFFKSSFFTALIVIVILAQGKVKEKLALEKKEC